jgi:hypothetical protein
MKHFVYLSALSLLACGGSDFSSAETSPKVSLVSEAGETSVEPGSGGSGGTKEGKAGAPNGQGGSEMGSAGTPDDLPETGGAVNGSAGMGAAGKASAGSAGMANAGAPSSVGGSAGMANAGSGNAGAPMAGMGMGGSDAPTAGMSNAGTGGTDSVAGSSGNGRDNSNNCNADGRKSGWTVSSPEWYWSDTPTVDCQTQVERQIGTSVLTLVPPTNCTWQYDVTSPESWGGCQFQNVLTCPTFRVTVTSSFVDDSGTLRGTVYFQLPTPANPGACGTMNFISFSGISG